LSGLTGLTLNANELKNIRPVSGYGTGSSYNDAAGNSPICDIESIDIQRWVHIAVVLSGRTQDIYINGKLARTCVLPSMFKVDGDSAQIALGGPYGFGGLIGTTKAANFAYSPDQVYKNYQDGPMDASIWTRIKGFFDPKEFTKAISSVGTNIGLSV
jgi:hypothetical protein